MAPESLPPRVEDLLAHSLWIQALARSLVRDPATADDLVQETWLAALRRPPRERQRLRPWLRTVLHNLARQRGRSESARERREADVGANETEELPSSAELLERAETQKMLVQAVTELPEPFRSSVLLHYYEGLSTAEIGRRRGVPAATVRSQLYRGIAKLRERLDTRHDGQREHWCAALAPLAGVASPPALKTALLLPGVLAVKLWIPAAAAVLACALWLTWRSIAPPSSETARADEVARADAVEAPAAASAPNALGDDAGPASSAMPAPGTDSSERATAGRGRGRVVERDSELPVEGLEVRFLDTDGRAIQEARSGADGTFAIPANETVALVSVLGNDDWDVAQSAHTLESTPEPVFFATRVRRAPFAGRLRDEESGADVPYYWISVRNSAATDATPQLVRTDAEGRFESEAGFRAGELAVEFLDTADGDAARALTLEHEPSAGPHALTIRVGPTYRVRLIGAGERPATDFLAKVHDDGHYPEPIHGRSHYGPKRMALRDGADGVHPWVRFPPDSMINLDDRPWTLEIVSADGLLYGSSEVSTLAGLDPQVHAVQLGASGAVRGQVRVPGGAPLAKADIDIRPEHALQRPFAGADTDENGAFELLGMPPGSYRVATSHASYRVQTQSVTLAPGGEALLTFDLEEVPGAGAIAGTLRSESGRYDRPAKARLVPYPHSNRRFETLIEWNLVGGESLGTFRFDDVPAIQHDEGRYQVRIELDDYFTCEPAWPHALPGDTDVELTILDDRAVRDLAFRVYDEAGGEVDFFKAVYSVDGSGVFMGNDIQFGTTLLNEVPEQARFSWIVVAPGHAPVRGEDEVDAQEGDEVLYVDVHLQRGWGTRVRLKTPDGTSTVGAEVLFDGTPAATLDERGYADVQLTSRPERIDVRFDGWRVRPTGRIHEDMRFNDDWWDELIVELEPAR